MFEHYYRKKAPNGYYISVGDNGAGILPDVLNKIFIPFFTTEISRPGIGLSLCEQIMNLHGGDIFVSSATGKGSCFSLRFVNIKK